MDRIIACSQSRALVSAPTANNAPRARAALASPRQTRPQNRLRNRRQTRRQNKLRNQHRNRLARRQGPRQVCRLRDCTQIFPLKIFFFVYCLASLAMATAAPTPRPTTRPPAPAVTPKIIEISSINSNVGPSNGRAGEYFSKRF